MTLFPAMFNDFKRESLIGKAIEKKLLEINVFNIRDFTKQRANSVDDEVYGGGNGMLMMAQPIYDCYKKIMEGKSNIKTYYMSPKGKTLTQSKLRELSEHENICILCGHYEGVDQRVLDMYVDEEISIGDYVLTGGELPALVLTDSLARLQKGVLSDDECFELESHYDGLLEYPQYTKPQVWRGVGIPDVLISGHHENIRKWRREQSIVETAEKRPDMLRDAELSESERRLAHEITAAKSPQKPQ